jgi:hypothetical protein
LLGPGEITSQCEIAVVQETQARLAQSRKAFLTVFVRRARVFVSRPSHPRVNLRRF